MGREKLCEIYGNGKTTQLLNRAVRAEIPGGEQVFEALKIANKRRSQGEDDGIFDLLNAARLAMRSAIAQKYDFTPLEEADGTL